jgi:unsaturated rhamnogalacturonyl hydrolase
MKNTNLQIIIVLVFALLSSCKVKDAMPAKGNAADYQALRNALIWQENNPIFAKAPTDWTNGAYYTGVTRAYHNTNDTIYLNTIKRMGIRNEWKTYERIYHADDVIISYAYLYLAQKNDPTVDLTATDYFLKNHFGPSDWRDGKGKNLEQSQLWWWCDALFMAPPIYTKRAKMLKDTKYLDDMHQYYMQAYNLLYNKDEKLFARDTRFVTKNDGSDRYESNGKKVFWSRGNGWVLAGLALLLDDMPKTYKHRTFYENLYKEMAERVLALLPADGLWRVSLLNPDIYPHGEVSGSGFFTFALAWGMNTGLLSKAKYLEPVKKAWENLKSCQKDNGMVGWVQNIGYDPAPASADSYQNFGTGAFLMAGTEVLKLK